VAPAGPARTDQRDASTLKYVALRDAPFSIEAIGATPWLLWATIERDANLADDPYRLGDIDLSERVDLPVAELASAAPSVEVPPPSVWLVGMDKVCEARVERDTARIELHEGAYDVSVSFALSGCDGTAWAPLAIVGELPASELRWSPVRPLQSAQLEAKYREMLVRRGATTPRVEVLVAHPPVAEVRYGEIEPDEGCTAWLDTELGVLRDGELQPWSCSPYRNCSMYELLGTLGTKTEARLAVLIEFTYSPVVFSLADETFTALPYVEPDAEAGERLVSFTDLDSCESEDGP
jgi:hypothetical protein